MFLLIKLILLLIFAAGPVNCYPFAVYQENFITSYYNPRYINIRTEIFKINKLENLIDTKVTFFTVLPDDTRAHVTVYKLLSNNRRVKFAQMERRFKEILEMDMYGIQNMAALHTRPPVAWPLQRNVTYHLEGWTFDPTKFPTSIPKGRYDSSFSITFSNKTRICVCDWIFKYDTKK